MTSDQSPKRITANLKPGMESRFKVRAVPVASMEVLDKPERLTLNEEEQTNGCQAIKLIVQTVNFPKGLKPVFHWLVEKKGNIPVPLKAEPVKAEELTAGGAENKTQKLEITLNCDYAKLGLFGKGTLLLELSAQASTGENSEEEINEWDPKYCNVVTLSWDFNFPIEEITFIAPTKDTLKVGMRMESILRSDPVFDGCQFELWVREKDGGTPEKQCTWLANVQKLPESWFLGCKVVENIYDKNKREIVMAGWPGAAYKEDYINYEYRLELLSPTMEEAIVVFDWRLIECHDINQNGTLRPLRLRRPKLTAFSFVTKRLEGTISQNKRLANQLLLEEIGDDISDLPQELDPNQNSYELTTTITVEGLDRGVHLPLLIQFHQWKPKRESEKRGSTSTGFPLNILIHNQATYSHRFFLENDPCEREAKFYATLKVPDHLFSGKEVLPFRQVLQFDENHFSGWESLGADETTSISIHGTSWLDWNQTQGTSDKKLQFQIISGVNHVKKVDYELEVDGIVVEGTTDDNGIAKECVPESEQNFSLHIRDTDRAQQLQYWPGFTEPEKEGIVKRWEGEFKKFVEEEEDTSEQKKVAFPPSTVKVLNATSDGYVNFREFKRLYQFQMAKKPTLLGSKEARHHFPDSNMESRTFPNTKYSYSPFHEKDSDGIGYWYRGEANYEINFFPRFGDYRNKGDSGQKFAVYQKSIWEYENETRRLKVLRSMRYPEEPPFDCEHLYGDRKPGKEGEKYSEESDKWIYVFRRIGKPNEPHRELFWFSEIKKDPIGKHQLFPVEQATAENHHQLEPSSKRFNEVIFPKSEGLQEGEEDQYYGCISPFRLSYQRVQQIKQELAEKGQSPRLNRFYPHEGYPEFEGEAFFQNPDPCTEHNVENNTETVFLPNYWRELRRLNQSIWKHLGEMEKMRKKLGDRMHLISMIQGILNNHEEYEKHIHVDRLHHELGEFYPCLKLMVQKLNRSSMELLSMFARPEVQSCLSDLEIEEFNNPNGEYNPVRYLEAHALIDQSISALFHTPKGMDLFDDLYAEQEQPGKYNADFFKALVFPVARKVSQTVEALLDEMGIDLQQTTEMADAARLQNQLRFHNKQMQSLIQRKTSVNRLKVIARKNFNQILNHSVLKEALNRQGFTDLWNSFWENGTKADGANFNVFMNNAYDTENLKQTLKSPKILATFTKSLFRSIEVINVAISLESVATQADFKNNLTLFGSIVDMGLAFSDLPFLTSTIAKTAQKLPKESLLRLFLTTSKVTAFSVISCYIDIFVAWMEVANARKVGENDVARNFKGVMVGSAIVLAGILFSIPFAAPVGIAIVAYSYFRVMMDKNTPLEDWLRFGPWGTEKFGPKDPCERRPGNKPSLLCEYSLLRDWMIAYDEDLKAWESRRLQTVSRREQGLYMAEWKESYPWMQIPPSLWQDDVLIITESYYLINYGCNITIEARGEKYQHLRYGWDFTPAHLKISLQASHGQWNKFANLWLSVNVDEFFLDKFLNEDFQDEVAESYRKPRKIESFAHQEYRDVDKPDGFLIPSNRLRTVIDSKGEKTDLELVFYAAFDPKGPKKDRVIIPNESTAIAVDPVFFKAMLKHGTVDVNLTIDLCMDNSKEEIFRLASIEKSQDVSLYSA